MSPVTESVNFCIELFADVERKVHQEISCSKQSVCPEWQIMHFVQEKAWERMSIVQNLILGFTSVKI